MKIVKVMDDVTDNVFELNTVIVIPLYIVNNEDRLRHYTFFDEEGRIYKYHDLTAKNVNCENLFDLTESHNVIMLVNIPAYYFEAFQCFKLKAMQSNFRHKYSNSFEVPLSLVSVYNSDLFSILDDLYNHKFETEYATYDGKYLYMRGTNSLEFTYKFDKDKFLTTMTKGRFLGKVISIGKSDCLYGKNILLSLILLMHHWYLKY